MSDFETREALLLDALQAELADKPITARFTARELAMIDQLHTRGYAATVELARDAGITPSMRVLDLGCGLGGPARYLAETYGCRVDGIDATAGSIRGANYLTSRWSGPSDLVTFAVADALAVPFPDGPFDLVWMQHVAMNIADRDGLYREIRRLLRAGGRLATYDVLRTDGELIYPTPWAADASDSTVLTGDQTRDAVERAGFRVVSFSVDTPAALAWVHATAAALSSAGSLPGAMMLRAALGDSFRTILGNLGRNYLEGHADVAAIIARAV